MNASAATFLTLLNRCEGDEHYVEQEIRRACEEGMLSVTIRSEKIQNLHNVIKFLRFQGYSITQVGPQGILVTWYVKEKNE